MTRKRWEVGEGRPYLRAFLAERMEISARQVKNLLDCNRCQVNGMFERFGARRLSKGDRVEVELGERQVAEPTYLHQDEQLVVLDKPAGWTSEACAKWAQGFLVHRLDRDTSGILLLAKQRPEYFEEQFRRREVKKSYLAVVVGKPAQRSGVVETQLGVKRRFSGQTIWGSVANGKWAKTAWEVVEAGKGESLVRCFPMTGRTHQIRVHLAEMGTPIVGDGQYGKGGRMPGRHLLHAEEIEIVHPERGESMCFYAPLPPELICRS